MRNDIPKETRRDWKMHVRKRVGKPLDPLSLHSLLIIIPGNSGDVAMSTTLIRYIKTLNPGCRITFATQKTSIPVAKLCPGIDDTLELPTVPIYTWSRQGYLKTFAGHSDAVVCPICVIEDIDLVAVYNAFEIIWLLSGIDEGIQDSPQQIWLQPDNETPPADWILARVLQQQGLYLRAILRLVLEASVKLSCPRRLPGSGIRIIPGAISRLSRHVLETTRPRHRQRLSHGDFPAHCVILSTHANSLDGPPRGVVAFLVATLRRAGRTVLHNVLNPVDAAPGTVPLLCSYPEFVRLRNAGIPFVGWRSGLCDIAAVSPAPMCVFYPPTNPYVESPHATWGFDVMNIAANCLEFICDSPADIDPARLTAHLCT